VLVDRLVGLAGFLVAAVLGLAYAVVLLGRPDLTWLLTTVTLMLIGFALAFAILMSQRLRQLVERIFDLGPLGRFLPLYQKLSDSVQVYRSHGGALVVALGLGLAGVVTTCIVNYLAAISVGADIPLAWVFVLTPLTAFAPFLPSIASGLGWNQGVFIVLYYELAGIVPGEATALAMSLAMQLIILVASLPGGVLWWERSRTAPQ
ncbi:lysylphosphatidylglycerol synthase domain-containing protein, partial [Chloroflexota bacterium]